MRTGLILGLALAAAALLAGCGLPPGVFETDKESPLLTAPPLTAAAPSGVWIAPIKAPPPHDGDGVTSFRRALARALLRRNIAAGIDSFGPGSLKLLSAVQPATHAGGGYVDVIWRLEGPDGLVGDGFIVATPLDFRTERPQTLAAINEVAERLTAYLNPPAPERRADRIVVATPPAKTVGFEDGAPLARAMAAALGARGFQPGDPEAAQATVQAAARIRPLEGRKDLVLVEIRWAVLAKDGRVVGVAEQANPTPVELTQDGLSAIAADAAAAAVESVAGLVRLAAKPPSTGDGAAKGDG